LPGPLKGHVADHPVQQGSKSQSREDEETYHRRYISTCPRHHVARAEWSSSRNWCRRARLVSGSELARKSYLGERPTRRAMGTRAGHPHRYHWALSAPPWGTPPASEVGAGSAEGRAGAACLGRSATGDPGTAFSRLPTTASRGRCRSASTTGARRATWTREERDERVTAQR
jgi:hypothetical protein